MLVNIELPHGLSSIGYEAFLFCKSLHTISIPGTVEVIGSDAFQDCISLVDVQLHEGLKAIRTSAFRGCKALTTIELPHGFMRLLGGNVFQGCESLQFVSIPSTMEEITGWTFAECTALVAVAIQEGGLVRIQECSFQGCGSLVTIDLPVSVSVHTNRRYNSFVGCTLLAESDNAIRGRFANLPVHKLCYNSLNATDDDLTKALCSQGAWEDTFGMTPFHIIATCLNAREDILQSLLDWYPIENLEWKDDQGKTMMDYLLLQRSSKAVPLIRIVFQRAVVDRVSGWGARPNKTSKLSQQVNSILLEDVIESRLDLVERLFETVGWFTMVEITSLLELALWKMKQRDVQQTSAESNASFGERCRYQSGTGVVIENMLPFLRSADEPLSWTALSIFPIYSATSLESDAVSSNASSASSSYDSDDSLDIIESDEDEEWEYNSWLM